MRQAAPYAKQFGSAWFFKKYIMQMTELHRGSTFAHCLQPKTTNLHHIYNKHLSYLGLMGLYVLLCCLEAAEEKAGGPSAARSFFSWMHTSTALFARLRSRLKYFPL